MAVPYLPTNSAINSGGPVVPVWLQYFLDELAQLTSLTTTVASVPGVNNFTVATQPALGPADAGYLLWLTDYKHLLRWMGATWEFFAGDDNAYFIERPVVPQTGLWQLCDGTATKYLTLGATLTETSFTTPNLTATPAYLKAAAAYTGVINAASGVTGTGTTGTGTTGTDVTGTGTTGTGTTGTGTTGTGTTGTGTTGTESADSNIMTVGISSAVALLHTHPIPGLSIPGLSVPGLSVPGLAIPALTVPGLSIPGLSVPALGVGSLDMANLGVLPFFRR